MEEKRVGKSLISSTWKPAGGKRIVPTIVSNWHKNWSSGTESKVESRPPTTGTQKKGVLWKRSPVSHRDKQDPQRRAIKQDELDMLELAAAAGEIDLLYLSGVWI